ncbi:MAG: DUF1800 domain-containing protein [Saprospiraceae bacterium]|nr:DUF1800 domain-containing protein [Saprospiraceae bacterium]
MSLPGTMLGFLEPFVPSANQPWDARRVQHFYQRIGFGATREMINQGLALTPGELVDQVIDGLLAAPDPVPPYWANWTWDDYGDDDDLYFQHKREFNIRWMREMVEEGIRAKLALFWHNHFVTEELVYSCNSFMWAYYNLLHRFAVGNFRTFVEEMGVNPAMLVYLNGNINVASQPNENYARELMELFTMGESNGYTQDDIVEVARALTGWRVNMYSCNNTVTFNANLHDQGQKTIFGHTGNWGYDDVHDLIFNSRRDQVAHYICQKLYSFFVYQEPNEEVAMANLFRLTGVITPDELTDDNIAYLNYVVDQLGQEIFNPVDVAGWPGYHAWLNENTMAFRWAFSANFLYGRFANYEPIREKLRALAIDLVGPDQTDPLIVTRALVDHFLKRELDPPLFDTAVQYFKGEIPENYFQNGSWGLYYSEVPYQIINLLYYITRLPEWQLG